MTSPYWFTVRTALTHAGGTVSRGQLLADLNNGRCRGHQRLDEHGNPIRGSRWRIERADFDAYLRGEEPPGHDTRPQRRTA